MRFFIDELEILFPYDYIYPEQYAYMIELKKTLDAKGHGVLEMPSGTGKTAHPDRKQLVYCSRTVPEIDKALAELKHVYRYRLAILGEKEKHKPFLGLGLSSRKNLCIHPEVNREKSGVLVDAKCHERTASWVRESGHGYTPCHYFEGLDAAMSSTTHPFRVPSGAFTLDDLMEYGRENGFCPYFLARKMLSSANVIIYSYYYLLDPKVAEMVSQELSPDAIVVFDEAHNIDNVCIEALSVDLNRVNLEASSRGLQALSDRVEELKVKETSRLQSEYERLVQGLTRIRPTVSITDETVPCPVLPADIVSEAIPGNIRKAEHFLSFLRRWVEFLKTRLKMDHAFTETPLAFLQSLKEATLLERHPMRFASERLSSLLFQLQITRLHEYAGLIKSTAFCTLLGTYTSNGFLIIFEPWNDANPTVPNPILHLCCLDASLCMRPIFHRFPSVIITSGTLSPLEMYPKILAFSPRLCKSFPMSLTRDSYSPMIVTRGSDQVPLSSRFEARHDPSVTRNYGHLLLEMARVTPDGLVVFFPSYLYMEWAIAAWESMGLLNRLLEYKLVFIETPEPTETAKALENYREACDNGRGAILLSVARGKVSEGIDFDHHYGRAVIMMGVPYQYTESRMLKARLEYLRETFHIKESDFLTFDAMRQAAQCLGRVLRGKSDYGLMMLADKRFSRADKLSRLPVWMKDRIREANLNLSTDLAVSNAKAFFKGIAQPVREEERLGSSLWDEAQVMKEEKDRKRAREDERGGGGYF